MPVRLVNLALLLSLAATECMGQGKPTLIIETFAVSTSVPWPYDMNQLKLETFSELLKKDSQYFVVLPEPVQDAKDAVYTLRGEVLEWHPGNRAKRLLVGMGTGRETAKIHYWLTDISGKRSSIKLTQSARLSWVTLTLAPWANSPSHSPTKSLND